MIGVFVSMVFMLLLYISKSNHRKWHSGECIFLVLWIVISFGSLFYSYFGVEEVSLQTWMIVLVGGSSFWFGCNMKTILRVRLGKIGSLSDVDAKKNNINIKLFYALVLISLPFLLNTLTQALTMIGSGMSLLNIRASYYGMHGHKQYWNTTGWGLFFDKYFVGPLKLMVTPIAITFCFKRKADWKILLVALFVIVTDILTAGGRFILVYVAVQAVVGFLVTKKQIVLSKRVKRIIKWTAIAAVAGIIYMTIDRNVGYSLWQGIFEYLCCCIPLLNHYVPKMDVFTFGTASLFGFLSPILTIVNRAVPVITPYECAMSGVLNTQNAVRLSSNITTNAFVTCYFYPYLDFGWIGLVLAMFLYGYWAGNVDKRVTKDVSERNIAVYLLMIQGVIKTIQHMPFSNTSYALALIYIFILTKDTKCKIRR